MYHIHYVDTLHIVLTEKLFMIIYVTVNCKSFQTTNKNRYNLQIRLKETFDKLNRDRRPPAYEVLCKLHTNPKKRKGFMRNLNHYYFNNELTPLEVCKSIDNSINAPKYLGCRIT